MRLKNMARPPASLPPTSDRPLEVSLILGSFVHEPTKFDLFDLFVPPSQTPAPHVEEAKFHELPSIHHTFHPEQKLPPKFVSVVFTALVFSPWAVLLGLVCLARFRIARSRELSHAVEQRWSTGTTPVRAPYHPFHSITWRLRSITLLVLGGPQARTGFTLWWYPCDPNGLRRKDCTGDDGKLEDSSTLSTME